MHQENVLEREVLTLEVETKKDERVGVLENGMEHAILTL
jgi:hypothetical protein